MSFGSIYLKHVFSRPAWTDLNVDQLKGWHMHMNGMPVSARMRWRLTAAWGGVFLDRCQSHAGRSWDRMMGSESLLWLSNAFVCVFTCVSFPQMVTLPLTVALELKGVSTEVLPRPPHIRRYVYTRAPHRAVGPAPWRAACFSRSTTPASARAATLRAVETLRSAAHPLVHPLISASAPARAFCTAW